MKSIFACALLAGLAFALPAAAQVEGTPGAIGTGNGMSGSNPGTDYRNGAYRGDDFNSDAGGYRRYPDGEGRYLNEGRAAAPDYDGPDVSGPGPASRPRNWGPGVGADLVGPGSNMDSPTDGHDVSR